MLGLGHRVTSLNEPPYSESYAMAAPPAATQNHCYTTRRDTTERGHVTKRTDSAQKVFR